MSEKNPAQSSRARIEQVAWAVANAGVGTISDQMEAISRLEAMEQARRYAEAKAAADEEEWQEEEQRLAQDEEARRAAREAKEWAEEQRKDNEWDAELQVRDPERVGARGGTANSSSAAGASSTSNPEDALSEALVELLQRDANRRCFDCEAPLSLRSSGSGGSGDDGSSGGGSPLLWVSVSHGLLLCNACGSVHATLASPALSTVRAHDGHLELDELDAAFASGHEAFATYLSEEVGVPRHVWLALPLDARYATPAAELYTRRLRAFMAGLPLPQDLRVPTRASPTKDREAEVELARGLEVPKGAIVYDV